MLPNLKSLRLNSEARLCQIGVHVVYAFADGQEHFYEEIAGKERLVRVEWRDGQEDFYEGDPDNERLVRTELPDGTKKFYQSGWESHGNARESSWPQEIGQMRLVLIEYASGKKEFYEGSPGQERLVRAILPDGQKEFYEGDEGGGARTRSDPPITRSQPTSA